MSYSRGPSDGQYSASPAWPPTGGQQYSEATDAWSMDVRYGEMPPMGMPVGRRPSVTELSGDTSLMTVLRAYPVAIGAFFVLFMAYLLFLQTRHDVPNNGTLRGISDLFVLFGSVVCAGVCWLTAAKLRGMRDAATGLMTGRAWVAWACLGGAACSYSVGQGIWTWYDANYTSSSLPFPAAYDPFYLAVYPLSWIGVALLIPRVGSAAGRTRLLLDAAIAVASALAISWYFILGPTLTSLMGTTIAKVVALAYPLGDLSLCVAAALLVFGPLGASALNAAIGRLGIGVTLLALTDSLYAYFTLAGTYHTGLLQDVGWPLSWLFIGWAALVYPAGVARLTGQRVPDRRATGSSRLGTTGAALRATTPMVLALTTCAILVLEVALRNTAPFAQVLLVCAVLFLLPVVRQLLTLVDNLILNERLRVALDQSHQAFQHSQQELMETSSRAEQYDELRAGIQDLQNIHAMLARGEWNARANVRGPLAPVAQSLNLLIERMNRWGQIAQANRVMETEAQQLRHVLDSLSEGYLTTSASLSRSPLFTGNALVSANRLERQLWMRFGRLREMVQLIGRHWRVTAEAVRQSRLLLDSDSLNQQLPLARESLARATDELTSNQAILQDLWGLSNAYMQSAGSEDLTGAMEPHSSGPFPFGSGT